MIHCLCELDCGNLQFSRGLCEQHFLSAKKLGTLKTERSCINCGCPGYTTRYCLGCQHELRKFHGDTCKVEGCSRPVVIGEFCGVHRSTPKVKKYANSSALKCENEDCENRQRIRGLCGSCYQDCTRSGGVEFQGNCECGQPKHSTKYCKDCWVFNRIENGDRCDVPGCVNVRHSEGKCKPHLLLAKRQLRTGNPAPKIKYNSIDWERFGIALELRPKVISDAGEAGVSVADYLEELMDCWRFSHGGDADLNSIVLWWQGRNKPTRVDPWENPYGDRNEAACD